MKIIFNRSYTCCGCNMRYLKSEVPFLYKRTCLCQKCIDRFETNEPGYTLEGTRYADYVVSPFLYKGLYREIFLRFKFKGETALGHLLGQAAISYYESFLSFMDFDYIVPVPLSKARFNERGFNQAELMAEYCSQALGIPIRKILYRRRNCVPQSLLSGRERFTNVVDAFEVVGDAADKRIIIFDDIFTTGCTVNECARTLREAGATQVVAVTEAYVERMPEWKKLYQFLCKNLP